MEPDNKKCQELLNKVRQSYVPDTSRDSNRKTGGGGGKGRGGGKRINIEETDNIPVSVISQEPPTAASAGTKHHPAATGTTETFVCETGTVADQGKVPVKSLDPLPSVSATPTAPPPLPTSVQFLKDEGNQLFRVGQYGSAVNKYSKAIKLLEAGESNLVGPCNN